MTTILPPLLLKGDCLVELKRIPDASIDAVVTDPPYGLGFMGKGWDIHSPLDFERFCEAWARECLRILKPGGHLLAFGGSRTWHRLAAGIEDAGFEIRDSIAWLYGSGFPKSMDVSKAIDKAAGAAREVIGKATNGVKGMDAMNLAQGKRGKMYHEEATCDVTAPATDAAREWNGWGTALKPAFEPIVVARKPLIGTVAANVLEHGTGALNIDATRIETSDNQSGGAYAANPSEREQMWGAEAGNSYRPDGAGEHVAPSGRWPANVVLDESQAAALDAQTGNLPTQKTRTAPDTASGSAGMFGVAKRQKMGPEYLGDSGGASRFFYVAKAPKSERPNVDGVAHPTVKPLTLMRWLLRLVTPPGGVIVDPFAGSGATLEAAYLEGFEAIGCELTLEYWPLIEHRIERVAGGA